MTEVKGQYVIAGGGLKKVTQLEELSFTAADGPEKAAQDMLVQMAKAKAHTRLNAPLKKQWDLIKSQQDPFATINKLFENKKAQADAAAMSVDAMIDIAVSSGKTPEQIDALAEGAANLFSSIGASTVEMALPSRNVGLALHSAELELPGAAPAKKPRKPRATPKRKRKSPAKKRK
jgi:hypothetical protein